MDQVVEDVLMFRGPVVAGGMVILLCAMIVGFRMIKNWIFYAIILAVGTMFFLSAVLYVNDVYPEDVMGKELTLFNVVIAVFQFIGEYVNPFVNTIDEFVAGKK